MLFLANFLTHLALALPEHDHAEHHTAQNAGGQDNGHQETQAGIYVERILLLKVEAYAVHVAIAAATRTGQTRVIVIALG